MTRCHARLLIFALVFGLVPAVGCEKRPNSPDRPPADAKAAGPANSATADAKPSVGPVPGGLLTAQDVLEKMAAAYKNASSYEDFGTLEVRQNPTQEQSNSRANFSVAFQQPNKLHIELLDGKVICDGKQWYAQSDLVRGRVVLREAPAKLSMNVLHADNWLYSALSDSEQFTSPQLLLLLENDPIKSLVAGSQEVTLDEPGRVGDHDCYRVRAALPDGLEYLWIDQKTFVLRMMVVPITDGPRPPEGDRQANHRWLVITFERAAPWRRNRAEGLSISRFRRGNEDAGPHASRAL